MVMLLMAQQLEKPQNFAKLPNRRHTFYRQERCPYVEIAKK